MKKFFAYVALVAFALPAYAQEAPRQIDFTAPILDQNGKPAHEGDDKSPILTIGAIVAAALYRTPAPDPRHPSGEDPVSLAKRALLAQRVSASKAATLTADEVVQIKTSLVIFPPLTVLRVLEAIDPASIK